MERRRDLRVVQKMTRKELERLKSEARGIGHGRASKTHRNNRPAHGQRSLEQAEWSHRRGALGELIAKNIESATDCRGENLLDNNPDFAHSVRGLDHSGLGVVLERGFAGADLPVTQQARNEEWWHIEEVELGVIPVSFGCFRFSLDVEVKTKLVQDGDRYIKSKLANPRFSIDMAKAWDERDYWFILIDATTDEGGDMSDVYITHYLISAEVVRQFAKTEETNRNVYKKLAYFEPERAFDDKKEEKVSR